MRSFLWSYLLIVVRSLTIIVFRCYFMWDLYYDHIPLLLTYYFKWDCYYDHGHKASREIYCDHIRNVSTLLKFLHSQRLWNLVLSVKVCIMKTLSQGTKYYLIFNLWLVIYYSNSPAGVVVIVNICEISVVIAYILFFVGFVKFETVFSC